MPCVASCEVPESQRASTTKLKGRSQIAILVTGAAGRLGNRVVELLLDRGYDVLGTDRVPKGDSPAPFIEADLCDVERVTELVSRSEAVIHMGAIPGPRAGEEQVTFLNNSLSTYNIMMAAAAQQVRRVVFSSSAFAMGWSDNPDAFVPRYLPLDEEHEPMPFETYGLSKQIGECIGAMVARSSETSVISLRFNNVVSPELQAEVPLEAPTPEKPRTLVLWSYSDPRDVAEAHLTALESDICGHEAFLLSQPKSRFLEPTAELIERNFGDRIEIRGSFEGNAGIISTKKAQSMLGLEFRSEWNQAL